MNELEANGASLQQEGQHGKVDPIVNVPQTEEQVEGAPNYVSREEFEQTLTEVERRVRKHVDSAVSTLDMRVKGAVSKVDELVELGKLSGMQFTQEQIAQLKDKAVHQVLISSEQQPQGTPEAPKPSQTQAPQVDPVTATAQMIMQKAGVVIAQDDPEISLVDRTTDDPGVFLESVRKAIEAKKQRLNRPAGNAAAVPGALATGSAPANLIEQFQREMREHRGQGMRVANEIKNKYRQKGVDVDNIRISW